MIWTKPPGNYVPAINLQLVGFNPFETCARQNGFIFPQSSLWKFSEKSLRKTTTQSFFGCFCDSHMLLPGYFCSPNPRHRGHKTPRVRSRATDLPHRDFHQPPVPTVKVGSDAKFIPQQKCGAWGAVFFLTAVKVPNSKVLPLPFFSFENNHECN